jgi:hypothetical protein
MHKTMKHKTKHNFRLVVDFTDKAVSRVSIKERSRDGKYEPLERPWGIKLLAGLKLATKAVTLASHGVADLKEACRTASAPRRSKVGKKRLAEDGGPQTGGIGLRHNGPDKGVGHNP